MWVPWLRRLRGLPGSPGNMIIHGARAAFPVLSRSATPRGEWLRALLRRAHKNKAIVALAAQLAGIVWAVLQNGRPYNNNGLEPVFQA